MPLLIRKYNLIFYAAPATGSTAVIDAFRKAGLGEMYPEQNIERDGKRIVPKKHATPVQMARAGLLSGSIANFDAMAGVRNPFSFHLAKFMRNINKRIKQVDDPKSWINQLPHHQRDEYANKLRRQASMSFEEYLHEELTKKKKPFIIQEQFYSSNTLIVHQENIQSDICKHCRKLGVSEKVEVERVNETNALDSGQSYHEFYNDDMIDLVYKWNAPSFARFPEYSFDGFNEEKVSKI